MVLVALTCRPKLFSVHFLTKVCKILDFLNYFFFKVVCGGAGIQIELRILLAFGGELRILIYCTTDMYLQSSLN